jgi:hypothetical protein
MDIKRQEMTEMQTPIAPEESRERFERWWPDKQIGLERYSDGSYFREHVRFAYAAWQAALADSGARELREALQHMRVCQSCADGSWEDCEGGIAALAALAKSEGK